MTPREIIVYVAGPYRNLGEDGVYENIQVARTWAKRLWKAGFTVICPHMNTAHFGGAFGLPDHIWLDGDFEIIRRIGKEPKCCALFMLPRWRESIGAKEEFNLARELGIPRFETIEDLWNHFFSGEGHIGAP